MYLKKILSGFLAAVLVASIGTPCFTPKVSAADKVVFPHRYENNGFELSKISHPDKPANSRKSAEKWADGLLDYVGDGALGVPGVDKGADGQGDRGQSYSWGSIAYGDWMYVSTLYSAMFSTLQLAPAVGHSFDPAILEKMADVLYRGDFFTGEADGVDPRCALAKINVKTGEVKILMSTELNGISGQFRNAVEYHDKLYFCGSPNGIPSIWEIDPKTDEFRRAYVDPAVAEDPGVILKAIKEKNLSIAIRGMTVFNDYLVISCVGPDANPYIAVSNNIDEGFTKIASSWVEGTDNTVKGELLGYPACRLKDSIYGGHIWEIIPFQNKLYVSICTGTPQNSPDGGKTMQSFALICGECPSGDYTSRDAWTWTPVVGDPEDGAAYPFGIDASRTRAGACTMQVFGDHLYIGEYNDAEIAMLNMVFDLDLQFLADNLEQSVNLYRMDADENIELVVGNPTNQFPESLSGLRSGFGEDRVIHENQYIWRMETFQDKLYIGTFDQGSLLYPVAQFSNGDILHMSAAEWAKQLHYIMELLKEILWGSNANALSIQAEQYDRALLEQLLDMHRELERSPMTMDIRTLPTMMSDDGVMDTLPELHRAMLLLPGLLEQDPSWSLEEQIEAKETLQLVLDEMMDCYQTLDNVPDFLRPIYELILNNENINRVANVIRSLAYLRTAEPGFDMFVSEDGIHFETITRNGMGDPYNQGLRALTYNDSKDNPWLCAGTANPFYGTQIWRLEGESLNRDTRQITTEQSSMGQIYAPAAAHLGETVQLSTSAEGGCQIMNLKVLDAAGMPLPLTAENDSVSFVMPDSTVTVTAFFTTFRDLQEGAYYLDAVEWAAENGVARGVSPQAFAPDAGCTRAHAITLLWRMAGSPAPGNRVCPFTDVHEDDYCYEAVLWAKETGVAVGLTPTEFGPDAVCKRSDIAVFLWRMAGSPDAESVSPFLDVAETDYYHEAVLWAVENGITCGTTENQFAPRADCVRGQIVTFLHRYAQR